MDEKKNYNEYSAYMEFSNCRPYYIPAGQRVKELAKAIYKDSRNILKDRNEIRKWAEEIAELCSMVDYLTDDDDE